MSTEHRCRLISAAYVLGFVMLLANGQSLATSSQKATLTVGTRHVPHYLITTEIGMGGKDRITVVPRSLMGSLFYVSQCVKVPPNDERTGLVTVTTDKQGQHFDLRAVTGGLMAVCLSEQLPNNDYLAVPYRGHWFHIEDSDLTSKSTFTLLAQLFALQAGEIKSTAPILTLPVGR